MMGVLSLSPDLLALTISTKLPLIHMSMHQNFNIYIYTLYDDKNFQYVTEKTLVCFVFNRYVELQLWWISHFDISRMWHEDTLSVPCTLVQKQLVRYPVWVKDVIFYSHYTVIWIGLYLIGSDQLVAD